MKKFRLLSTVCGLGLLAASATAAMAQSTPTASPTEPSGADAATPATTAGANPATSAQDAQFVQQASADGMAEVMMGHLAVQRGRTSGVRGAGQMMVVDHSQANTQLMGIAQTLMLKPAPGPNAMQRAMYQQLENAPAGQFDAMWEHGMIQSHETAAAFFKNEESAGQAPQLRQFAMTTLPVIYKHIRVVRALSPMRSASMSPMGQSSGAMSAPIQGNPDHSADQLNAQELNKGNPS